MREGERLHSSTICIAHVLQGKWSFLSLVVAVAVAAAAVVVVASPSVVVSVISGCGGRGDDDGEEEENDDGGYGEKKKPGGDGKTTNARDAAEGGSLLSSSSSPHSLIKVYRLPTSRNNKYVASNVAFHSIDHHWSELRFVTSSSDASVRVWDP